jgi:hypothetical protein
MREYLRAHPDERDRYAEEKRRLAADKSLGLLVYSLRKLAITVDMVDRAQVWRAAAVESRSWTEDLDFTREDQSGLASSHS